MVVCQRLKVALRISFFVQMQHAVLPYDMHDGDNFGGVLQRPFQSNGQPLGGYLASPVHFQGFLAPLQWHLDGFLWAKAALGAQLILRLGQHCAFLFGNRSHEGPDGKRLFWHARHCSTARCAAL